MGMRSQWFALALVTCAGVASARAQPSRGPEAETLFVEGKRAMGEQAYDLACAKFAASQTLEPRASTLMNLGACHEAAGHVVSAWYAFNDAAKLAELAVDPRESGLVEPSKQRAMALEPRRSSLTVLVADGARVNGLLVERDGEPILEAQWNSPIYLDGGEYTIVARAADTDAWTAKVALASELDEKRIEIPVLHAAAVAVATDREKASEPPVLAAAPSVDTVVSQRPAPVFTTGRKIAVGVAAAGVSAAAVGVVYAIAASSKQADSNELCPDIMCGDSEGLRLNAEARSSATKANVLWLVGGLAVAGGATLWFLKGPDSAGAGAVALVPTFGIEMGGVAAQGSF